MRFRFQIDKCIKKIFIVFRILHTVLHLAAEISTNISSAWTAVHGKHVRYLYIAFSILYTITPDDGLDLSRNML
jgi:hypothetical protein